MKSTRLVYPSTGSVITRFVLFAVSLMCSWSAFATSPNVVISQAYGGGGNTGSVYKNDFIELFNRSSSPVSLTGWSVQYASSTGSTWTPTALTGTIPAYGYYLVQESAGAGGTTSLPTPDASGSIAMSGTTFKVAVCNTTTALSGTNPTGSAQLVDFVGAGASANSFEGSGAAPAPSNTNSVLRASGGCTDSDNNATDFAVGDVNPRNTASPINNCGGGGPSGFVRVETQANGSGIVVPAQSLVAGSSITVYAIQRDASTNFVANVAATSWSLSKSGSVATGDLVPAGDLKSAVFTGHGAGTALITANSSLGTTVSSGTITVTATTANQVRVETAVDGTGTVVSNRTVVAGETVTMYAIRRDQYTNFVDNIAATAWSLPTKTGAVADGDLIPAGDLKSASFVGNGQGTATVRATSAGLTPVDSGVLTVTNVPPAAVVISQVYGGGGNSGGQYANDFVELFNRTGTNVSLGGWSIQYAGSSAAFSTSTNFCVILPSVNIAPYSYFLVELAPGANTGATQLPTPDAINTNIAVSASAGKFALANTTSALGTITWPNAQVIDLVAFGTASTPYEGTGPAPTLSNTTAAQRNSAGCSDTDNNAIDFTAVAPAPRNSASGQNICQPQPPNITSIPNQSLDSSATVGPISFNVSDQETPAASLNVTATSSNQGLLPNANISLGGGGIVRNITLHPVSGQTGSAQITVMVTDTDNMTASTTFYLFVGSGPNLGIVFADDFSSYADGTSLSFVGDVSGGAWHTTLNGGISYQLIVSNQQAMVSIPTTNTEDVAAMFTNGAVSVNSGAILYTGCKLVQTALPSVNGEYFLHLKDNTTSNFFCRLFATTNGAANGKFRLGLSNKSTTGPNVVFPVDLDLNTTCNVAMRYKVSVGASTLWVNPTSINDTSVSATDTPNLLADISQVALREPGTTNNPSVAGSQMVDNLVVSTSFSDVVTLTALPPTLTGVRSGNSITITWPTNNNSGYVLQSASTVNATTWNPVGGVTTSGANYTVTIPFTSTPAYFRLKK